MKVAKRKKKRAPKHCKVVRNKRTGHKRKVCRRKKHRRKKPIAAPIPKALPQLPVPSAAAPPATAPLVTEQQSAPVQSPAPDPPTEEKPPSDPGPALTKWQAERLLWRAGFGPRPGDVDKIVALRRDGAIRSLTRPSGSATLTGPEPHDEDGHVIDPENVWGHDHVWWLDRMVRSNQPLVERMTLVWHDWFATSNDDVGSARLMLEQNELFRTHGLGSFETLALEVTKNPAMLVFLSGLDNQKDRPNENYARELMELFTLGADRGAYTETDVRELARCLTGWDAEWDEDDGYVDFHFDPELHDDGTKTLWEGTAYAKTGAFDWQDAVKMCLRHPMHAEFFVRKLWSYFIPTPPPDATRTQLQSLYTSSGFQIRPVLEAILAHPDLYAPDAPMVKPPAVYTAGLLRLRGRGIDTTAWSWLGEGAGQMLFYPPNVAGWNDNGWLDTSTVKGRWDIAWYALSPEQPDGDTYSTTETGPEALLKAMAHWSYPLNISDATLAELSHFANTAISGSVADWEESWLRAMRFTALCHLIVTCPDFQTS